MGVFAKGIAPFSSLTQPQREAYRATNPPHSSKVNPGLYKNYRRVTRKKSGEVAVDCA